MKVFHLGHGRFRMCPLFHISGFLDKTPDDQIGSIIGQLADYNSIDVVSDTSVTLQRIIEAESLILPGGISACSDGCIPIVPSCCCGLERWRDWIKFLSTGENPWLGHDPSPYLKRDGQLIHVWSDGCLGQMEDAYSIDFTRLQFHYSLSLVHTDLRDFLILLGQWAGSLGFNNSQALVNKFDSCFLIKCEPEP